MRILGLSAFYHDSAAALVEDGRIVRAAQEERFTRRKHDPRFPHNAVSYCLEDVGGSLAQVDYVTFYDKPFIKFERLIETYLAMAPRGFTSFRAAIPVWLKEKLFLKRLLQRSLREWAPSGQIKALPSLLFTEHHISHQASAFYPSPFEEAAVLSLDGVGEWATTACGVGRGNTLEIHKEIHFPHSLGLLYSAFTYQTGFRVNSGEYKLMGLAPYGTPRWKQTILDNIIDVKPDGSFRLNQEYFDYCTGLRMTSDRFSELFGVPPRSAESELRTEHMDLAASVQAVTEEVVLRLARSLAKETGLPNLCLAGGVALNCVANGEVLRDGPFERIWIQPAAGDAGGAVGAALATYHGFLGTPRSPQQPDGMSGCYLGPDFEPDEVRRRLTDAGARSLTLPPDEILDRTAALLADGRSVGWFHGRMEFGPRALGHRSILADPRRPETQRTLNLQIKYRESFRPFAPMVMVEDLEEWFELSVPSPYMLLVAPVTEAHRGAREHDSDRHLSTSADSPAAEGLEKLALVRGDIPAVTHVDYSARIQTVSVDQSPRVHELLRRFKEKTGCPVLVNTSFNVRGEPIVCTPEDAFRCFMGTELDVLVVENCLLMKEDQDPSLLHPGEHDFALD